MKKLTKRGDVSSKLIVCVLGILAVLTFQLPIASAKDSLIKERQSYFAHIGAASHALRLHESGEAQYWLSHAPKQFRGWEWHFLDGELNQASARLAQGQARALSVSRDGRYLFTAHADQKLSMHLIATGKELWQFLDASLTPQAVAFHPHQFLAAAAFSKHRVMLWDGATGHLIRSFQGTGRGITTLAWSPDGRHLASASWNSSKERGVWGIVEIWDVENGQRVKQLEYGEKPLVSIAYSPDGKFLAVGSWEVQKTVAVWETKTWDAPFLLESEADEHYKAVQSIHFSADSQRLAAGGKDGRVRVWDLTSRKRVMTLGGRGWGHSKSVNSVAFHPDGRFLASASTDQTVRIWDLHQMTEAAVLLGHNKAVYALQFSFDGAKLFSAGLPEIMQWDQAKWNRDGVNERRWKQVASVYGLKLSQDGQTAYTAAWKGGISVWDVAQSRSVMNWQAHQQSANALDVSEDQLRLVSVGNDGRIVVWTRQSMAQLFEVHALLEEVKGNQLTAVHMSRDGTKVFSASQAGAAKLWNAENKQLLLDLKTEKSVSATAMSHHGKWLATGCADGTVQIWDATTGNMLRRFSHHRGAINYLSFSPDGQALAAASSDRTISQMPLNVAYKVLQIDAHDDLVYSVAYSPDGLRLVSASSDQTVKLWDKELNKVFSLNFEVPVYRAQFSSDGKTLYTLPMDASVAVFRTARAESPIDPGLENTKSRRVHQTKSHPGHSRR